MGAIDIDVAAIFYTSGSTGKPKGVVLSHRNLLVGGASVSQYLENDASDVILAALPLSFDAGFSQLDDGVHSRGTCRPRQLLARTRCSAPVARHQVTGLTCVPPLWIQLTEQDWPEEATRGMRYFANTGGRMPRTTLGRLRDLSRRQAVSDVRADRGLPLDLP